MKRSFTIISGLYCIMMFFSAFIAMAEQGVGIIEITETAGLNRDLWPVKTGVPVPEHATADSLVLVMADADEGLHAVPFQILDEIAPVYFGEREPGPGKGYGHEQRIKIIEIAFLVQLPARETIELRLYRSRPGQDIRPAPAPPQLSVEQDDGLARTINTGVSQFRFHPDSGQLINYKLEGKEFAPDLAGRGRFAAVHGSADIWSPPYQWGNVRQWSLNDESHNINYREVSGPVVWSMSRTGYVPNSNEAEVSLAYTVFAGMPFIYESTEMRFSRHTQVNAVRNNQLVFRRGHHTHGVYMEHDGKLNIARGYDPENPEKRYHKLGIAKLPPDIPFIGMFCENRHIGIGMVTLGRISHTVGDIVSAQNAGAGYYFFDGYIHRRMDRNFFYFSRAEIFPAICLKKEKYPFWSWYSTVVPAGSMYASNSAILTFITGDEDDENKFEMVEYWTKLLRNPPRVITRWQEN